MTTADLGADICMMIGELAAISERPDALTRLFLTPEHRQAADLLIGWMRDAGMRAHMDAIGNVCGRYEGTLSGAQCLMLGSHFDTVRDAGKWDGPLGVVTAIACVAELNRRGQRFDFAIEIVAFADEEGVRFSSTLLGSRAVAGTFQPQVLDGLDADGVSMANAMRAFGLDPALVPSAARRCSDVLAYVELHIEQGPVLEDRNLPVGIVSAISGATRLRVTLTGMAGHAGTVPMHMRKDALAGAAEAIAMVESHCGQRTDLVGTVGWISALPGASNVIPGQAILTLDIRSASDEVRVAAVADIMRQLEATASRRQLALSVQKVHENASVDCVAGLQRPLAEAILAEGYDVVYLPSGAGHDGMAMVDLCDIAMLFVRCRGGISHHPDEHVEPQDAATGARVLLRFIETFKPFQVAGSLS